MSNFECLYFLENSYLYIIEVKMTNVNENADASEKYKWLRIDKETLEITPFKFAAMDSSGEIEERFFDEGYLKFNRSTGMFIEKYNSAQHPLDRRLDWKLSTAITNLIEEFLR